MKVAAIRNGLVGGRVLCAMAVAAGLTLVTGAMSQPASAATKSVVVVGDLCSCTGPEASTITQTTAVVNAWATSINAAGGLNGHQVQIVVKDDGYNPATSSADAKSLVQQNHVIAIFDNSDEDASLGDLHAEGEGPGAGCDRGRRRRQNPTSSRPAAPSTTRTAPVRVAAHKAGIKKLRRFSTVPRWRSARVDRRAKALLPKVGMNLVYSASIGFAAPNYSAQCLAAKQAGARSMSRW